MSTIRPLATIAVLAALGVFLALKIHEDGPVAMDDEWSLAPADEGAEGGPDEAPPFEPIDASVTARSAAGDGRSGGMDFAAAEPSGASRNSEAPAMGAPPATQPASLIPAAPKGPGAPSGSMDSFPDLPPLPQEAGAPAETAPVEGVPPGAAIAAGAGAAAAAMAASAMDDLPPPANVPVARYSDAPAPPAAAATTTQAAIQAPPAVSGRVPSLGAQTQDLSSPPPSAGVPDFQSPAPTRAADRYAAAAGAAAPPVDAAQEMRLDGDQAMLGQASDAYSAASETTPLEFGESASQPIAGGGSTAADGVGGAPPAGVGGFEAAWPLIQDALSKDELTRAHRMLSEWRDDSTLTPDQRRIVDDLLGQLAGTVVYSTEHRLEPAHRVAPGETLATIAALYDVPWQLLAKINHIAAADAVTPGQELKVVRGPFAAEVDPRAGELVLLVDGRYAGRFPARAASPAPGDGGAWIVGAKGPGSLMLENEESPGATLEVSAGPPGSGRVSVAAADAAELCDILSIGSRITFRK